jgi:integrase
MQVRNSSKSVATEQASLSAINVLFAHAANANISLIERFKAGKFLDSIECEALRRVVQVNYGPESKRQAIRVALGRGKRGYIDGVNPVANETQYMRLTRIAHYLGWLGHHFAGDSGDGRVVAIAAMKDNIFALRPVKSKKGTDVDDNRFTREHESILIDLITPGSSRNPFRPYVQLRNQLVIELLRLIGKRRGEILNIRVGDFNPTKLQINIVRRQDNKDDHRVDQPNVKTHQHTVPISPDLADLINRYLAIRRTVPGAIKKPYLLVTHKPGPTQGQAMTKAALTAMFQVIKNTEPRLSQLHPHLLRHFNSDELARTQHEEAGAEGNHEHHRRQRNHLAGRAPESEMDSHYTQRETERQSKVTALRNQEAMKDRVDAATQAVNNKGKTS